MSLTAPLQTQLKPARAPALSFTRLRSGLLQRTCACGGSNEFGGECETCKKKRLSLQRSTRHPEPQTRIPDPVPPIVHEVLRSPGRPLDPATRAFMEPRFGHDFGEVRVHTDTKAAESARAVNALAFTVGRNVVFGAGQYVSGTHAGQRLLAHELTHVVQQGASVPATLARQATQESGNSPAGAPSGTTARLLALADNLQKAHDFAAQQRRALLNMEAAGEENAPATTEAADEAIFDSLQESINRIRGVAAGNDEVLKQRVLSGFTPERLAQSDAQMESAPKEEVIAQAGSIPIQQRATEQVATKSLRISDAQDPAEIEADRVAEAVVASTSVSVKQTETGDALNRQVGEALVAAGTGLLVAEGEAAPVEAATGPPGWVVGAAVTLTAVTLLGIGYLLTRTRTCPPCPPNPGPEIDRVPPSAPHYPCLGDHWHYRVYNQNPQTCQCFLSGRLFGGCCGEPAAPC